MKSDPPTRCQRLETAIALPRSRSSNHDKEDVTTSSGASPREALFDNQTESDPAGRAAKAGHATPVFRRLVRSIFQTNCGLISRTKWQHDGS